MTKAQLEERIRRGGGRAAVDPSARGAGFERRARSPQNNTIVLSCFSIQVNTLFKAYSEAEAEYMQRVLSRTMREVLRKERVNEYAIARWPEHAALGDISEFINRFALHFRTETGNPNSRGGRVHAHSVVYIEHRSNLHLDIQRLNRALVEQWNDELVDDEDANRIAYHEEDGTVRRFATTFRATWPSRKFNVRISALRVSGDVHALWYMTKNDPNAERFWLSGEAVRMWEQENVYSQKDN